MIIFFESGRLGNQLFQYCAIRKFNNTEPVVAIGMQELKSLFTGVEFVGSSVFGRFLEKIIKKIGKEYFVRITQEKGWITLVEEVRSLSGASFKVTPGWIKKIVYFNEGYYQSENIVESKITNRLVLKDDIVSSARKILEQIPCQPEDRFFVHIRRGDYLTWPTSNSPAVLPLSWYRTQMARIRAKVPAAHFIVVSDDHLYIEECFSKEKNVSVVKGEMKMDFAVMTKCLGGGVLSASSFSWWGAYFCRRTNPQAIFLAPFFWGGHRQEKWHPEGVSTSWINYARVK